MRRIIWILLLSLIVSPNLHGRTPTPPVRSLFDSYERGDYSAVDAFKGYSAEDLASEIRSAAPGWIRSAPNTMGTRRLIVAAVIVEVAHAALANSSAPQAGATPEWHSFRALIEWACSLVRSGGRRSNAERAWFVAMASLGREADDWTFLIGIRPDMSDDKKARLEHEYGDTAGQLLHANNTFPQDKPRWQLIGVEVRRTPLAVDRLRRQLEVPRSDIERLSAKLGSLRSRAGLPRTGGISPRVASDAEVDELPQLVSLRDAEREFEQLAGFDVTRAEASLNRGIIAQDFGERDAAVELYTRALVECDAGNTELRYLALLLRGRLHQLQRQDDLAVQDYLGALHALPGAASAATAAAALLFARGEVSQAVDLIDSVRTSHAGDPWFRLIEGNVGPSSEAALQQLRRALRSGDE